MRYDAGQGNPRMSLVDLGFGKQRDYHHSNDNYLISNRWRHLASFNMNLSSPYGYVCGRCAAALRRSPRLARTSSDRSLLPRSQRRLNSHVVKDGRPFRLAVIGSGPAGFYTAYKVMSLIQNAVVDMYEHLPVPYGLVRYGVAPDHPEVKVPDPFPNPTQSFLRRLSLSRTSRR